MIYQKISNNRKNENILNKDVRAEIHQVRQMSERTVQKSIREN
jgi:hypothetical protein